MLKRKLMVILVVVVMLGSVVTMLGITATAQTQNVPNIAGTWTGTQDTTGIEQYNTKFVATQSSGSNQVQGTYTLTVTKSEQYPENVGKTGSYSFTGAIDENGNFIFSGPKSADSPTTFSSTMSATWKLSTDQNSIDSTAGVNYVAHLDRDSKVQVSPSEAPTVVSETIKVTARGPTEANKDDNVRPWVTISRHLEWSNGEERDDNGQGAVVSWNYAGLTSTSTVGADGAAYGPTVVANPDRYSNLCEVAITDTSHAPTTGLEDYSWTILINGENSSPSPSPSVTQTPAGQSTSGTPGFEAVYAVAGVLAVAYVLMRRRT